MKIIDSHNHFWQFDEQEHNWMEGEFTPLRRDFMPEQFEAILNDSTVSGTIAVQARESLEETRWLLELADEYPFIKGVVGWIDLFAKDAQLHIKKFAQNDKMVGLRNVFQGKDPALMLDAQFIANIALLEKYDLTYDLLIIPEHLPNAIKLVQMFPNQKFVVDHLAKPAIAEREMCDWAENMKNIAQYSNVYCKLSGMLTEGGAGATSEDITFYVKFLLDTFGVQRIMYGSDWPVMTLGEQYSQWCGWVKQAIAHLSDHAQSSIMADNAASFYRI